MSLVMWDVTELIASLAENIIIIDFYSKFHGMKYSGIKNILMSVFIVFFLTLFSMLTENYTYFSGMTALISVGIIIVYGIIFLEGKLFTKVLVPLLLFFVIVGNHDTWTEDENGEDSPELVKEYFTKYASEITGRNIFCTGLCQIFRDSFIQADFLCTYQIYRI